MLRVWEDVLAHVPAEQAPGGRVRRARRSALRVPARGAARAALAPTAAAACSCARLLKRLSPAGFSISYLVHSLNVSDDASSLKTL